jgi:acyl carrier protein
MNYKGVIQGFIDILREDEFIMDNVPESYKRKDNPEEITEDTSFRRDLGFDSLGMSELGYAAETRFGIENQIDEYKFLECETIGDAAKLACRVMRIDYPEG